MNFSKISPARPVLRMKKSSATAALSTSRAEAPASWRAVMASSRADGASTMRFSGPVSSATGIPSCFQYCMPIGIPPFLISGVDLDTSA